MHGLLFQDLVVRAESRCFMKGIRQMSTGIGRQVTGATCQGYFHFTKHRQYFRDCIGTTHFLFQNTENQERNEADHEVCLNPAIPLHVYRPRIKVVLHDAEGFFDFPSPLIHTNDFFLICFKFRVDCIDAIKLGFFCYNFFVNRISSPFSLITECLINLRTSCVPLRSIFPFPDLPVFWHDQADLPSHVPKLMKMAKEQRLLRAA